MLNYRMLLRDDGRMRRAARAAVLALAGCSGCALEKVEPVAVLPGEPPPDSVAATGAGTGAGQDVSADPGAGVMPGSDPSSDGGRTEHADATEGEGERENEGELDPPQDAEDGVIAPPAVFGTCHIGYAYDGGTWRRARIGNALCSAGSLNSEQAGAFGVPSDLPLLFGSSIATYGTEEGIRRGRFLIDHDGNMTWSAGDSNLLFMPDPQAEDQPFVIQLPHKLGSGCEPTGAAEPTVGIKRGRDWYIDTSGNGIWDDVAGCDTRGTFGEPGDVPTPIRGRIAVSYAEGGARRWWWDADGSFSFTEADVSFSFGLATDHVFSDSLSGEPGSQRGRQVFLNLDEDLNYSWGDVDSPPDYLPSEQWRFVGRFSLEPPVPVVTPGEPPAAP